MYGASLLRGIRIMQGGPYPVLRPPQSPNLQLYQTFTQVNKRPTRDVGSQPAFTHGSSYRSQVGTESPGLVEAPVVGFSLCVERLGLSVVGGFVFDWQTRGMHCLLLNQST